MTNLEIAAVFRGLAALLVKKKESRFKIRAYLKVAEEIEKLPAELAQLSADGKLREIPGVGDIIEMKIKEMLTTGKLQKYEDMKAEVGQDTSEPSAG